MQINVSNSSKTLLANQTATAKTDEREAKATKPQGGSKQDEAKIQNGVDSFVKSPETTSVTYTRETMTVELVAAEEGVTATESATVAGETSETKGVDLSEFEAQKAQEFQNLIKQMLGQQFEVFSASSYVDLELTEEQISEAQAAVAEGGDWSAESVANRILDMAESLSGGDPEKLAILKDAVIEGFDQATETWGEEMPEITGRTYDLVMSGFDAFEQASTTQE